MICEHCGKEYQRGAVAYRRNRHCSRSCKSAAVRKITPEALREAALAGMTNRDMARKFETNRATVLKWLRADGVFEQWARHRYKKCAVAA